MVFTTTKNNKTTFTKLLWVLVCMFSTQLTFSKIIYVNDGFITRDIYTTAIGSNANSGLTPALPKLTLAAALGNAVAGDTIYIDSGTYGDLSLTINIAVTIIGAGNGNTIFNANNSANRFANITSSNVTIKNIGISRYFNDISSSGQVINIAGVYTGIILDGITIVDCLGATNTLPSINIDGGASVTIKNSLLKCSGLNGGLGGAIRVNSSTLIINNSLFKRSGNTNSNGGAIQIAGISPNVTVTDCSFDSCTSRIGGAIYQNTGTLYITGSCFTNNISNSDNSTDGGGAIYATGSLNTTISNCSFSGNLVTNNGVDATSADGCAIKLWNATGTFNLNTSSFSNNFSATLGFNDGQDLFLRKASTLTGAITNCTFGAAKSGEVNIFNNNLLATDIPITFSKNYTIGGTALNSDANTPTSTAATKCIDLSSLSACGVTINCTTETIKPLIIKCVDDKTLNCPTPLPDYRSEVSFFDDCTTTITQLPTAGSVLSAGTTTVKITITDSKGNSSTCTFNVTVTAPVAGTISGAGTVCSATNSTTLTLSGSVGTIQWQSSNALAGTYTDIVGATSATHLVTNLAVPSYFRAIVSIVSCTSATATSVEIKVLSSNIWTGSTSTAWNIATNWACGVPLSGDNIEIPSGLINYPVLDSTRTIGNIINAAGATVNLNNATLVVLGVFSGTGTLIGGGAASGLTINGSGDQGTFNMNQTNLGNNEVGNFTLNSASGSATLGNPMRISGILTLTNGTFNTGGNLTLMSNGSGTAVVAPTTNCPPAVAITGDVTVERYFPLGRAFRFISSPVTTTTSIRDNWQEGVNNLPPAYENNLNLHPGYGTHITGSIIGDNGFDVTQTTNNSMFTFNNSTAAWAAVPNTNTLTLTVGVPYRLMIRGDRSISMSTNAPTATNTTLRAKGTLKLCDAFAGTMSESAGGFSFIGNPYQATVDIKAVLAQSTNVNPYYYSVWDPKTNSRGGYVIYDLNSGIKNVLTSKVNAFLQPWQACFVKTTSAGAASISFKESNKATTSIVNELVYRTNSNLASYIRLTLYESNSLDNNGVAADGLIVKFGDDFDNAIDENDALKFNNQDETFSTKNNTSLLGIESRLFPVASDVIPLKITQYRFTNYTMVASGTNMTGLTAYLHDQLLQTYTEIPQSDSVNYSYSINANDATTSASDRFRIVFQNPFLNLESNNALVFTISPNPSKQGVFDVVMNDATDDAKLIIYNTIGQEVYATNLMRTAINHINPNKVFANAVYYVKIKKDAATTIKKLIIR